MKINFKRYINLYEIILQCIHDNICPSFLSKMTFLSFLNFIDPVDLSERKNYINNLSEMKINYFLDDNCKITNIVYALLKKNNCVIDYDNYIDFVIVNSLF